MIVIGKIGSPYGIKGSAKLISYADPPENINKYKLFTKDDHDYTELKCKITTLYLNKFIINVPDCQDRDKASQYTNTLLYMDSKELSKQSPNEYFWKELIGLTAYDLTGTKLGVLSQIIETGSHDVLIISGNNTYTLPFIQGSAVIDIDLSKQTITIDKNYAITN